MVLSLQPFLSALGRPMFGTLISWLLILPCAFALEGRVVDEANGQPLPYAHVVQGGTVARADAQGRFLLPDGGWEPVSARAIGYRRGSVDLPKLASQPLQLALAAVTPKALYLSPYGIADSRLRGDALRLAAETELNALVIDIKGDASVLPHASAAWEAAGLGAQQPTVRDFPALLRPLRERGLYLIARVVVFKDQRLAYAHPQWAVRDAQGEIWHDREGLAWIDPMRTEAWAYALAVAEEAAQMGFDEVQFDYLRFPDATDLRFARPTTESARVEAIGGFLDAARARLAPYNVFVSADVFGYICWNQNDTQIGQRLESLAGRVDYLSPMLYPSGFTFGIPQHRDPVAVPYEIVHHSLARALQRTSLPGVRFRPWLQAFRDYAFDRREFGAREIRAQIDAAEAVGSHGWMLWNAGNRYHADGLRPAAP